MPNREPTQDPKQPSPLEALEQQARGPKRRQDVNASNDANSIAFENDNEEGDEDEDERDGIGARP